MMAETQDTAAGAFGERSPQPGRARAASFRVLLWKEWRQQRWTFLGMSALALALFVLGGFAAKRWSFGLSGAAYLFTLLGVPLVLSARAFTSEDEDGTDAFLRELPFRPLQVFWAKLLVVVLASWAATGLLLLLGWLWAGYPDDALGIVPWLTRALPERGASTGLAAIWMLAPVAAAQASLLASLGTRSLTTALLVFVCLCLCVGLGAVSAYRLDLLHARGFVWFVVGASVTAAGAWVAGVLSARRHPSKLAQLVRGTGGCAAVMALFLVPGALSLLYLGTLARPEAYVRASWWRGRLGRVIAVAPSLKRPTAVLLACGLRSGDGAALALLDPATGQTAWLDNNVQLSARVGMGVGTAAAMVGLDVGAVGGMWSPDGSRVAWIGTGRTGLAAISWRRMLLCVHDLTTQRTTRVHGQAPALPFMPGWSPVVTDPWSDCTWMAGPSFCDEGAGVGFVNTVDGSTHVCPPPSGTAPVAWKEWRGTVVVRNGAVFTAVRQPGSKGTAERLTIARCTPGDVEAAVLDVNDPPPGTARLRAVSPDEKWALFAPPSWERQVNDLVDLGTGARRRIVLPPEVTTRLTTGERSLRVVGFTRHGAQLLFGVDDALALYDPVRDTWQVQPPPGHSVLGASSGEWTVSPDGTRLMRVQVFQARGSPSKAQVLVFDLHTVQWTVLTLGKHWYGEMTWYGNEHVLLTTDWGVSTLGLDGSREVLWPRE